MAQTPEEKKAAKLEVSRAWQKAHTAQVLEKNRKWKAAHPDKVRAYNHKHRLKRRYGITDGCDQLLATQGGVCAVCGRERLLEVDHNHTTGKVRGMLCRRCNMGLGCFEDDAILLRKAVDFIDRDGE
jgi:hypothetical protein